MNEDHTTNRVNENNPWKTGVIATGGALLVLVAAGFTFAAFNPSEPEDRRQLSANSEPPAVAAPAPQAATPAPAPAPRENCGRYLANAQRDTGRVVKDGAVGAMVGAGTGAAGGAIADGGSGAGKGAGIGAVVGAVAGAFHGLTEENARTSASQQAYNDCLARNDR